MCNDVSKCSTRRRTEDAADIAEKRVVGTK